MIYHLSNTSSVNNNHISIQVIGTNGKSVMSSYTMNNKSGYHVQSNLIPNSTGFYSINLKSTDGQCEGGGRSSFQILVSSVIYQHPTHSNITNIFLTVGIAILSLSIGYLISMLKKYLGSIL